MSTACTIGLQDEDNILATFCIDDGYFECAGLKLYRYFSEKEKIRGLIKLGAIMDLGTSTEFVTDMAYKMITERQTLREILEGVVPQSMVTDSGEQKTVIDTYHREVRMFKVEEEFWDYRPILNVEYNYLFKDGVWYAKGYMPDVNEILILPFEEAFKRKQECE